MRPATAGVKIVASAPVSRSRVTGTPLADRVTIGALRRVATVVSPKRTVPQPLAAATGNSPAHAGAADIRAVVTIAPLMHRFMREEVTFGAAQRKKSNITASRLSRVGSRRACL